MLGYNRGITQVYNNMNNNLSTTQNIQTETLVESWLEAEKKGEQFPVPFDMAWKLAGYSTKANAKRTMQTK